MTIGWDFSERVRVLKWRFSRAVRAHAAKWWHEHRWSHRPGDGHLLPGQLIVSLTSYPRRFGTLHLTLRSLMNQSVAADEIILWIDASDQYSLPNKVLALAGEKLKIEFVEGNLRSYNKIVPALQRHASAYIVTADDDIYYEDGWLDALISLHDNAAPAVICHRAHQPYFDESGRLLPYHQWGWEVSGRRESNNLFPTGVGGVFYPPGILPKMAQDVDTFTRLAPAADDAWLYFMGRQAGVRYKLSGRKFRALEWPATQLATLNEDNVIRGGNDRQIQMLEQEIGLAHWR